MQTAPSYSTQILSPAEPDLNQTVAQVVKLWRQGEVVAIPTETVYGLGADAANPEAVAKIYTAKGRPSNHPLIVHGASWEAVSHWFEPQWLEQNRPMVEALAQVGWPGPLTLIGPRAAHVPDAVTGGQSTVGLRVPNHPVTRRLLEAFGGGVAAPSANRFGRISPTTAQAVVEELGGRIPVVVDGGPCMVGVESTIVDVSGAQPRLLRPGMLSVEALNEALRTLSPLGKEIVCGDASVETSSRAPGTLPHHYAPQTPVFLMGSEALTQWLEGRRNPVSHRDVMRTVVLGSSPAFQEEASRFDGAQLKEERVLWLSVLPQEPVDYARQLYATLRQADALGWDQILIEEPGGAVPGSRSAGVDWTAVVDRLSRAAALSAGRRPQP